MAEIDFTAALNHRIQEFFFQQVLLQCTLDARRCREWKQPYLEVLEGQCVRLYGLMLFYSGKYRSHMPHGKRAHKVAHSS